MCVCVCGGGGVVTRAQRASAPEARGAVLSASTFENAPDTMGRRDSEALLCPVSRAHAHAHANRLGAQICMDRQRTVVTNCGHLFCGECAEGMAACAMCRQAITDLRPVYF